MSWSSASSSTSEVCYTLGVADDASTSCCGACEHARMTEQTGATVPASPPLRARLSADGSPVGVVLVVEFGARETYEVPITRLHTTIGRGRDNDLPIPQDKTLSKRTCALSVGPDGIFIEDLQSFCGTYVNGSRAAKPTGLHQHDVVRVGQCALRVRVDGS